MNRLLLDGVALVVQLRLDLVEADLRRVEGEVDLLRLGGGDDGLDALQAAEAVLDRADAMAAADVRRGEGGDLRGCFCHDVTFLLAAGAAFCALVASSVPRSFERLVLCCRDAADQLQRYGCFGGFPGEDISATSRPITGIRRPRVLRYGFDQRALV